MIQEHDNSEDEDQQEASEHNTEEDKLDQQNEAFRELMRQVRDGSEEAAWQLVTLYGPHIRRAVRRRLNPRMRSVFDSEDFVQAVWASMIRMEDGLRSAQNPLQFANLLARVASNKVIDEVRRQLHTVAHGIRNQVSANNSDIYKQLATPPGSTASHFAIARDEWNQLLKSRTERTQLILRLKLSGMTFHEVAEKAGVDERTARRAVKQVLGAYQRHASRERSGGESP